ncbi:MAG TPA: hypothetical protein VGN05_08740 [Parvibaculum sp.]|jgi:hypothetical protein
MGISRLFRPLDYLRVRHEAKFKYDYGYPLAFATLTVGVSLLVPIQVNVFGNDGLIKIISGLIGILAGFFIASLAAIATFNNAGMDRVMPGQPPVLDVTVRGRKAQLQLTRRRFLSLLFGYLSMLSIFLYLIGEVSRVIAPDVVRSLQSNWILLLRTTFLFLYMCVFANLLVTTLLGLFFMSDRIHRSDSELKSKLGLAPEEHESELPE